METEAEASGAVAKVRQTGTHWIVALLLAIGALLFAAAWLGEEAAIAVSCALARLFGSAGIPLAEKIARLATRELRDVLVIAPALLSIAAACAIAVGRARWQSVAASIEAIGERRLVVAMCCLAAAAATAVAGGVFHWNVVNPDSVSHLFQARTFASGKLWVAAPQPQEAFETIEVITANGRMLSKYPPGTGLMLLPAVLLGWPWLVCPALAFANTYVVYLLGRRLYGQKIALWATALLAFSPLLVFNSATLLSHAPAMLFGNLAVLLTVRLIKEDATDRDAVLLGLAIAAGILTRPLTGLALGIPLVAAVILSRKLSLRSFAAGALALTLCLGLLLGYQYLAFGTTTANPYAEYWPHDRLGFGKVGIGSDAGPHYFTTYSVAGAAANTWHRLKLLSPWLFGWPVSSLVLLVLPFLRRRLCRADLFLLALPASLALAYAFYWYEGSNEAGPSYLVPAVGFLALLSAKGLSDLHSWLSKFPSAPMLSRTAAIAVVLSFAVCFTVFVPFVARASALAGEIVGKPERLLREAGVEEAIVFVSYRSCHPGIKALGLPHPCTANDPLLRGRVAFALDRGNAENQEVLRQYARPPAFRLLCATVPTRLLGTTHYHPAALMPLSEDAAARDARDEIAASSKLPLPKSRAFRVIYGTPAQIGEKG